MRFLLGILLFQSAALASIGARFDCRYDVLLRKFFAAEGVPATRVSVTADVIEAMTPVVLMKAQMQPERDFLEGLVRKGRTISPRQWDEAQTYVRTFDGDPYTTTKDLEQIPGTDLSQGYRDIAENVGAGFALAAGKLGSQGANKPKELEALYLGTLKTLAPGGERYTAKIDGEKRLVGHNGDVIQGMGYAVAEVMKSDDLAVERFVTAIYQSPARDSLLASEHFMPTLERLSSKMKETGNHIEAKLFERMMRDHLDLLFDGNRTATNPVLSRSYALIPSVVRNVRLKGQLNLRDGPLAPWKQEFRGTVVQ